VEPKGAVCRRLPVCVSSGRPSFDAIMGALFTFRNVVVIALLLGAAVAAFFNYQFQDHKVSVDEFIVLWIAIIVIVLAIRYIAGFVLFLAAKLKNK
jgi:hypothetical protein